MLLKTFITQVMTDGRGSLRDQTVQDLLQYLASDWLVHLLQIEDKSCTEIYETF